MQVKCKLQTCCNVFKKGNNREYCCYECKKIANRGNCKQLYNELRNLGMPVRMADKLSKTGNKAREMISLLTASVGNRENSSSRLPIQPQH